MTTYGPYTPVRRAGNLLFVSGQVGIDPVAGTASPDVAEQTAQALRNMQAALETAEAGLNDVIKTTVFLADMDDFAAVNTAYERFFETPRPARSTVAIRRLPRVANGAPLLVEIEAVAHKESR